MTDVIERIKEKSVNIKDADFLPNIFGNQLENILSNKIPVILFGAGSAGKELLPVLKIHGIKPIAFCDNSALNDDGKFLGLPILSFGTLKKAHKDSCIFITNGTHSNVIFNQLLNNGFDDNYIFNLNSKHLFYYTHIRQFYWTENDLLENKKYLQTTYNLLEDKKSKDLFISRISLFCNGADYLSYRNFICNFCDMDSALGKLHHEEDINLFENYFYFNNDVFKCGNDECVIDGGAYIGDTVQEFMSYCKTNNLRYKSVYSFEPDPNNFIRLEKAIKNLANVHCWNKGLWSKRTTLKFKSSKKINDLGASISIDDGDIFVDTISIDQLFKNKKISLIKMDIEGAEVEALLGAKYTIEKNIPKLAICIYHKKNDIFEIPILINKLNSNYKIYLRHYSNNVLDTILFAVPKS